MREIEVDLVAGGNVRRCCRIQENVSVLEVLRFWTMLQVLLERVAPVQRTHWGDGCLVDDVCVLRCHCGFLLAYVNLVGLFAGNCR